MSWRYFLTEPRTVLLGWVLARREREVSRAEYVAALELAGYGDALDRYDSFDFSHRGGWVASHRGDEWHYVAEVSGRMARAAIVPEPVHIDNPRYAPDAWDYPRRCAQVELALAATRERVEEWDREADPHGWWHERPLLIALHNEVLRLRELAR